MKGQCARFIQFTQSKQSHPVSMGQRGLNLLRGGTIARLTQCTLALTLSLPIVLPVLMPLEAQAGPRKFDGRRVPGGRRDVCLPKDFAPNPVPPKQSNLTQPSSPQQPTTTDTLNLIALVREVDMAEGAKTTSANPIVWVYVPYSSQDQHRQLWLSLDEQGDSGKILSTPVPKHTITLPNNPGIMPIALPADITLDVNKTYRWSLQTTCFGEKPKSRPPIQFSITRVSKSATDLKSVDQRDRLVKDGLWLDALMIGMQNQRPGNLSSDFKSFLESHLLGKDLAQEAERLFTPQEQETIPSDQWAIAYLQKITAQPLVR